MQPRLRPQKWFVIAHLCVTVLLVLHVYMSAWMVVEFDGTYEEGRPAPTEIHALVVVNSDQTLIDVEMERATSFFLYSFSRNSTYIEPEVEEKEQVSDDPSSIEYVEVGRTIVLISLVLLVLSYGLYFTSFRFSTQLLIVMFILVLLNFFIIFPMFYVYDISEGNSDDLAFSNFSDNNVQESLLHQQTKTDWHLSHRGVLIDTSFSGYDLGLIAPSSIEEARNSSVENASTSYQHSFIEFSSSFSFQVGKNIPALYILPMMWFFFPMLTWREKKGTEEE